MKSIQEPFVSVNRCFLVDILGCPCLADEQQTCAPVTINHIYGFGNVNQTGFFSHKQARHMFLIFAIFQLSRLILLLAWIKKKTTKHPPPPNKTNKKATHKQTKTNKQKKTQNNNIKKDHLAVVINMNRKCFPLPLPVYTKKAGDFDCWCHFHFI